MDVVIVVEKPDLFVYFFKLIQGFLSLDIDFFDELEHIFLHAPQAIF